MINKEFQHLSAHFGALVSKKHMLCKAWVIISHLCHSCWLEFFPGNLRTSFHWRVHWITLTSPLKSILTTMKEGKLYKKI